MRVFVTGGTGHAGSYIIPELIAAGHEVTGLARSDTAVAALSALGAKVRRGDLDDLDGLKEAAADSDGVIHLAFNRELMQSGQIAAVVAGDLAAVLTFGEALAGTGKPPVALPGSTANDCALPRAEPWVSNLQKITHFRWRRLTCSGGTPSHSHRLSGAL